MTKALLFFLMTVVPMVELYLLIQLSEATSAEHTIWMVLLTGFLGAYLAKREGLALLAQLKADLRQGLPPAVRVVEGLLVLTGSLLLITPGVMTDVVGLLVLVPPVRRFLAPRLKDWLVARITRMPGVQVGPLQAGPAAREAGPRPRFDHPVT